MHITSEMASTYLDILPRTMIWFLTVQTTYPTYITLFAHKTLETSEMEDNVSLVDHLVLISLCVLFILGERIEC